MINWEFWSTCRLYCKWDATDTDCWSLDALCCTQAIPRDFFKGIMNFARLDWELYSSSVLMFCFFFFWTQHWNSKLCHSFHAFEGILPALHVFFPEMLCLVHKYVKGRLKKKSMLFVRHFVQLLLFFYSALCVALVFFSLIAGLEILECQVSPC